MEIEFLAIIEQPEYMDLNAQHGGIHLLLLVRLKFLAQEPLVVFDKAMHTQS